MQINLLFDAAAQGASQAFRDTIQAAANLLDQTFSDNVTLNISVGYGEVQGSPEASGGASAGPASGTYDSYTQVKNWLSSHASSDVQSGVNALPSGSSIQGNSSVVVWSAQEKLMGQIAANATGLDGDAGFGTGIPLSSLEGVAIHELTHAMGRINYGPAPDTMELYRYTAPGTFLFQGGTQNNASYFSLDGGKTVLADFGQSSDPSDFLNNNLTINDPLNEYYNASTVQHLTNLDILEMESLGFHAVSSSKTPAVNTATPANTFAFNLTSAHFSFANGHDVMSEPNGSVVDVTALKALAFADGTVTEHAGSALVDDLYYDVANADVWTAQIDPTTHYNQYGWHDGRNPNADFSTVGYLAANRDVANAGINPLAHYDQNGWKEGRDPSASFDNELYLKNNPDVAATGMDPLTHFLQFGQAEGRQAYAAIGQASSFTHGSFDAEYYLLANPDVAKAALASGGDTFAFAYQHYETSGWHEGRMADAYFDPAYYLAHNPDVAAAGIDPLTHYDLYGWREGRDPSAAFHTNAYLAANPDVAAAHIDPLLHYLQFGADEGRHLA